ncbi:MAG: hypothetical protein LUC91_09080 [Prevotella sp.]|nr:hypothetical protein [Prevotella sp.]
MIDNTLKVLLKKIIDNRFKILLYAVIPLIAFILGLLIPSPFVKYNKAIIGDSRIYTLSDTVNMMFPNGDVYDGSIIASSKKRHGFGRLTRIDSSIYEGNWKEDKLPYGQRTTSSSVYVGRFNSELNNHGFGIVTYSSQFIDGKRKQGVADKDIIAVYIGNWNCNIKQGIGRSVKVDGSMDFGNYSDGVLQEIEGANYRIGGCVYGIDVSHYQPDIDWDNLALYCDKDGRVYSGTPKEKKYMQPVFFAYIKATEGSMVQDNTYSIRNVEAERHGIVKGAYHFFHLTSSVEEQVRNFIETVNWKDGDMPPALDVEIESEIKEYGKEKFVEMTLSWLEKVEENMHVRPIIYTRESIRNNYLNDERFKKYDFWIASYKETDPDNFDWHFWQLTEKGVMNGYKDGRIDINLFKGDYLAFKKYLKI